MKNQTLKDGIFYASVGSLWWGVLGTYFFQYISYNKPCQKNIVYTQIISPL